MSDKKIVHRTVGDSDEYQSAEMELIGVDEAVEMELIGVDVPVKPPSPFRCMQCGKSQFNEPGRDADDCKGHRNWAGILFINSVALAVFALIAFKVWEAFQ